MSTRPSLSNLSIPDLQALAKALGIEVPGRMRWKRTYIGPIEKHLDDNETTLRTHPEFQKFYVAGTASPKAVRTTSADKNQLDAAAAAATAAAPKAPPPALAGLLARKLTSDPPGLSKKDIFMAGVKAKSTPHGETPPLSSSEDEGPGGTAHPSLPGGALAPPPKPATPRGPLSPEHRGNDDAHRGNTGIASVQTGEKATVPTTPRPRPPSAANGGRVVAEEVKLLLHGLSDDGAVQEVVVPLSHGVHIQSQTQTQAQTGEGTQHYVFLDDVLDGLVITNKSPFKGRLGSLRTVNRDTERVRNLGPVPDVVEKADYHRFTRVAAMNKHDVYKVGDEFELDLHYKSPQPAQTEVASSGAVLPATTNAPPPAAVAIANAPPQKRNVDNDPKFFDYLRQLVFKNTGRQVWSQPRAEVMRQRLNRYLHVNVFEEAVVDWKASHFNGSYDIPLDWNDESKGAIPGSAQWAGAHFTVESIRFAALGMGHTTAAQDAACFTLPRGRVQDYILKRLQPVIDWRNSPDDPKLSAYFAKMSYREFSELRQRILQGKAKFDIDGDDDDKKKKRRREQEPEPEKQRKKASGSRGEPKRRKEPEYDEDDSEDLDS